MSVRSSVGIKAATAGAVFLLSSCGGGGSGGGAGGNGGSGSGGSGNSPPPSEPVSISQQEASSFLMAASFGPTEESIIELTDMGYADWIKQQTSMPPRSILNASRSSFESEFRYSEQFPVLKEWYENAVSGDDQLRQRAAFALSQIFVISNDANKIVSNAESVARYMDILQYGTMGNFRDLLEEVTYSPAMGIYLTYMGNEKANPMRGSAPDENYARELMQLFTIGLYELNTDGTVKTGNDGEPIETYTNDDITELAKVFTGLYWADLPFKKQGNQRTFDIQTSRMEMTESAHSPESKSFLGRTIPSSASGNEAISQALDILFEHPNTAPFFCKQMIQRLTTSNPSPAYVQRVVTAFETGRYTLPDRTNIGSGTRGDLRPVWAAILLDDEFLDASARTDIEFGKVREPVLRFVHALRVVGIKSGDYSEDYLIRGQDRPDRLGQQPFKAPSVFNYYRPGYVAAGSETASAGLVAPELQITTQTSVVGYANYMRDFLFRDNSNNNNLIASFENEIALAEDPDALVERLDLLLTAGRMDDRTKQRIRDAVNSVNFNDNNKENRMRDRIQLATLLVVTSPEFIVQQ